MLELLRQAITEVSDLAREIRRLSDELALLRSTQHVGKARVECPSCYSSHEVVIVHGTPHD